MLSGAEVAAAMQSAGFTHVVWLPDSHLGRWDAALQQVYGQRLLRVTREGEGVALAAGLILGGARPLVAVQCTGFFEAGDAVRNVVHDMHLPLKLLVGVRGARARAAGSGMDNCPEFAPALVAAWKLPALEFDPFSQGAEELNALLRREADVPSPRALLWVE